MRILTISHFYDEHGGGVERVAAQLCRQFAKSGHQVVWAASDADQPPAGMIETLPLRCANPIEKLTGLPMPIPGPRSIAALARAVRDSDAVVVHDSLYFTSVLAMLLAKAQRKPVVLIQHIAGIIFANQMMSGIMKLANALVTRPMLGAAHRLVFISDAVRRELLGEVPRRTYMVLHNGVDTTIFYPNVSVDCSSTRAEYGLPVDSQLAIFVGRFVQKKGLSVLKNLAARRPDLHIAMVGMGPMDPASWGLPNVHVLGPLDQSQIAELFGAANLLILPSVGEGYPLVVQEAMACGLPVVCGECSVRADPDAGQWLRGIEIDLSDPEGSSARCSDEIDRLSIEPVDRTQMAAYAAGTYSWSAMAKKILLSLKIPFEPLHHVAH